MQEYRKFTADVRRLYESSSLTYDEIARELGISNGTVSRSVAWLKKHEGMAGRGCGGQHKRKRAFRPGPSPIGGKVTYVAEPSEHQYVNNAVCFRCGVREEVHGKSCRLAAYPTSDEILAQPNYVDRAWDRMLAKAYEMAVMK